MSEIPPLMLLAVLIPSVLIFIIRIHRNLFNHSLIDGVEDISIFIIFLVNNFYTWIRAYLSVYYLSKLGDSRVWIYLRFLIHIINFISKKSYQYTFPISVIIVPDDPAFALLNIIPEKQRIILIQTHIQEF